MSFGAKRPVILMLLAAILAGCGGGSTVQGLPGASTFAVGGTVSGLLGTLVLQNNGADTLTLSANGPFTFHTALTGGASYSVTVATQPSNEACSVSDGSGTVSSSVSSVTVICNAAASGVQWVWSGGANVIDTGGQYGNEGTPLGSNIPGAREAPSAWSGNDGNFYLFGGFGYDTNSNSGLLNDLWRYSPSGGQWVWIGGADIMGSTGTYGSEGVPAANNSPPAREAAATWSDAAGQLWLFGGLGADANQNPIAFNDLWKYQPSSSEWIWIGGSNRGNASGNYGTLGVAAASNVPPPRAYALSWVDSAGELWLFGGAQYDTSGSVSTLFNDLWSYNPTSGEWTWIAGSSSPGAAGHYGTQGSGSSGGVPGARAGGNSWLDGAGNLWLFGGYGIDQTGATGELNDLWLYSPSANQWTWVSGAATVGAGGTYGTQGVASTSNAPGARVTASAWRDAAGNFYLFGGYGDDQSANLDDLNDLWQYSPSKREWTWFSGSPAAAATGNYGTQGVAAPGNAPGAREQAASWIDAQGKLWLFGGYGYDSLGQQDDLNDLWSFGP